MLEQLLKLSKVRPLPCTSFPNSSTVLSVDLTKSDILKFLLKIWQINKQCVYIQIALPTVASENVNYVSHQERLNHEENQTEFSTSCNHVSTIMLFYILNRSQTHSFYL
jgi:hypothetical protein